MNSRQREKKRPRTLDVRPILARGDEPFQLILETVASLGPTEDLLVISPFLPSPLIEKLHSEGFRATPERRDDGAWTTYFTRD